MKPTKYDPKKIEKKWQKEWKKKKVFEAKETSGLPKKFVMIEFPYPSGAGLHMGHMRPFVAGDVVSKYWKLQGKNTMYPIGWDAFGLPAENYAIKNKVHPSVSTKKNISNAKRQLEAWGTGFDWSREIDTTDPAYYKWTQKIFLEFFKAGLAYEKEGEINWCPKDKTGLANEEVIDGKCERCGTEVEKKNLRQWYLKITDYAQKLLDGLQDLPEWPEHVKLQQENWIGRSEGAEIAFKIKDKKFETENEVTVFTTRADTLFGATYLVLAPEHPLVDSYAQSQEEVKTYIENCKKKSEEERTNDKKEKTGVEIKGLKAINPASGEEIPVWIADYVLGNYGTGAIMAVPAHDDRDLQFARKFNLPIKPVVVRTHILEETQTPGLTDVLIKSCIESGFAILGDGLLINSKQFDGYSTDNARKEIIKYVGGKIVTKYKLRDWVFSRQRYWGEPIPLIHCKRHGVVAVPDKDLPVKLPSVKNYEPTGTGESPLAAIESWVKTPCPQCLEESKKTKYLVFDFDGVLGNTIDAALKSYMVCGWAKNTEEAKVFLKNYFSKRPFHAKGHTMTDAELKKFYDESMVFGKSVKEIGFKLFESFVKEIKKIKNAKIAVVSSGSCQYSEPALKKSKLKIEKLLTCEDSFSKEEKLEKIAKMWKVDLSDLYYFTDANNDVYELENLLDRKKIIGCSWGYIGYDALRETLPEDQVLKKPKDIHDVFKPLLGRRETNTMPQWAGSSWYWLRYMDPKNKKEFASKKAQKYWSPVDLYFGGMEHTTLHLLYSRFWNLFLYDRGLVTVKEPYKKRVPHGIILGPDGEKMSKSRGNVVNPDELIALYGADTVRLYMMFLGPHGAQVAWNDKGIVGARRFLERVLQLPTLLAKEEDKEVTKLLHKTIKKVEEDLETFSFNTAVSAMMIFVNKVYELKSLTKKSLMSFLELLAPMAPHLTEEMWQTLGNKGSIFTTKWPKFDPKHILETEITIVVQVNGKVRTKLLIPASLEEAEVVKRAQSDEQVVKFIEGKELKKAIYIKGKLVNLVI